LVTATTPKYVRFVGAAEHVDAGGGGGFAAEVDAGVIDKHVERLDRCRRGGTGAGVGDVEGSTVELGA
jgi:hypothetical protein